jgi:hypothetical protein
MAGHGELAGEGVEGEGERRVGQGHDCWEEEGIEGRHGGC